MEKLLGMLLVFGSFSTFANSVFEEVHMDICQQKLDVSTYRNTDNSSKDYVVITRGVVCSKFQQRCQRQQRYFGFHFKNEISIDKVSYIWEGEAKVYKNKLYICNK